MPDVVNLHQLAQELSDECQVGRYGAFGRNGGLHVTVVDSHADVLLQACPLMHKLGQQAFAFRSLQGVKVDRRGCLCGQDGRAHGGAEMIRRVSADCVCTDVEPAGEGIVRDAMG